jgi:hypothetical protein
MKALSIDLRPRVLVALEGGMRLVHGFRKGRSARHGFQAGQAAVICFLHLVR